MEEIINNTEIEDMPDFDETATEVEETQETDTASEAQASEEPKKEAKLTPYEQAILTEMERRAYDGDELLATAMQSKDKNIKSCFDYVKAQAKKKAVAGCAMIEDAVVYGWAHHYYIESKETIDAELAPKTKAKTETETKTAKKKAKETPKPIKNTIDFSKVIVAKKADTEGKKPKREKKKDNLLAGFIPMERPNAENYKQEAKKGSREQAKSVEQLDMFADFFAE